MNKYNSRICYKQHNQRTSMLVKLKNYSKVLEKYSNFMDLFLVMDGQLWR